MFDLEFLRSGLLTPAEGPALFATFPGTNGVTKRRRLFGQYLRLRALSGDFILWQQRVCFELLLAMALTITTSQLLCAQTPASAGANSATINNMTVMPQSSANRSPGSFQTYAQSVVAELASSLPNLAESAPPPASQRKTPQMAALNRPPESTALQSRSARPALNSATVNNAGVRDGGVKPKASAGRPPGPFQTYARSVVAELASSLPSLTDTASPPAGLQNASPTAALSRPSEPDVLQSRSANTTLNSAVVNNGGVRDGGVKSHTSAGRPPGPFQTYAQSVVAELASSLPNLTETSSPPANLRIPSQMAAANRLTASPPKSAIAVAKEPAINSDAVISPAMHSMPAMHTVIIEPLSSSGRDRRSFDYYAERTLGEDGVNSSPSAVWLAAKPTQNGDLRPAQGQAQPFPNLGKSSASQSPQPKSTTIAKSVASSEGGRVAEVINQQNDSTGLSPASVRLAKALAMGPEVLSPRDDRPIDGPPSEPRANEPRANEPRANERRATERLSTERATAQTTSLQPTTIRSQNSVRSSPTSARLPAALAGRLPAWALEPLHAEQLPPIVRPADIVDQTLQSTRGTGSTDR